LIKAVELNNQLLELEKERELILANTTEKDRERAKIQNELSPTEKILQEYEAEKLLLEQKLESQKIELE
jgi:hypothetical protein